MNQLLGLAELLDVLPNPLFINEDLFAMGLGAFIGQMDFQTVIKKREFAHPIRKDIELKFGGDGKNFGIRQKCDQGAGMLLVLDLTNDLELACCFASGKGDQINFAVPGNFGFEPLREGVHTLRADAVQATGEFISSLAELAAGMQVGQHQLDGGHLKFRMHLDRYTASVIPYGGRAVDVDGHVDLRAEPG